MGKGKQRNVRVLDRDSNTSPEKDKQLPKPSAKTQKEATRKETSREVAQSLLKVEPISTPTTTLEAIAEPLKGLSDPVNMIEVDLGLDISTSITGVVLLSKTGVLRFMGHVPLTSTKLTNLFEKADAVIDWIKQNLPKNMKVCRIFVEANAKGYSMGFSSADTLFTLAKMNALVSYLTHKWLNVPVLDVNVTSARSKIGYKNNKGDKRAVKEKVREFVLSNNPHLPFKTRIVQVGKKKGSVVPAAGVEDQIDAFVVCRGGQLLHP